MAALDPLQNCRKLFLDKKENTANSDPLELSCKRFWRKEVEEYSCKTPLIQCCKYGEKMEKRKENMVISYPLHDCCKFFKEEKNSEEYRYS